MIRVAVTGAPRTGTSLCMQTLRLLGVPIAGLEYHEEAYDPALHPHGEWGFPYAVTASGVKEGQYDGKAMKLFGHALSQTAHRVVASVIVCSRNPIDTVASIRRMLESDAAADFKANNDGLDVVHPQLAGLFYSLSIDTIYAWLQGYPYKVLHVDYDGFVANPEQWVSTIAEFVGIHTDTTHAVENVIRREVITGVSI